MTRVAHPILLNEYRNQKPPLSVSAAHLDNNGGPPQPPDMEARVAKLELGFGEVKAALGRMEPLLIRIETQGQKTAVEVAELRGAVGGLKDQVNGLPKSTDLMRIIFWVAGINALATFGAALLTFLKH